MDDDKCEYEFSGDPEKYAGKENGFEPIPLTGKWLLKFGFKKYFDNNNESYFRINDDMFITADYYVYLMGDDAFECLKLKRKIKYIHQLQNLYFSLTGKELTIKT